MSGSRVTRLAALAGVLVLSVDLAINGHPTILFDIGFVVICVGAALAVRPADFFRVGVLPPLLLLGLMTLAALIHRAWLGPAGDGVLQAVVSGLAHRASGLLAAYLLTLAVLAIRQHVIRQRRDAGRVTAQPNRDDVAGADPLHHRRAVGEVDDRGRLRPALTGVDHRVHLMVQLLLDLPAVGHRRVLAGQQQRAGEDRLVQRPEQRLDHRVVGDPDADGALLRVHQPPRHLGGRRQDERVRAGRGRLDRAERRVGELHQLAELREVGAHQREVVPVVEAAQPLDPLQPVAVAELDAERVAGVGRVGDQPVLPQQVDHRGDGPRLRVDRVDVDVAGHQVSRPGAAARRSRRSSGGRAKISDSSAVCTACGVGVAPLGEEVQHSVDQVVGHRGARGDADAVDALEPGLVDLAGVVDPVRRLGAGLEGDLGQPHRVGGVGGADHDHQVGAGADLLDRELPVLGGVADVVAGRVEQLREALPDRVDRRHRLVDRQRGLGEPGHLLRVAHDDPRRRRPGPARAGCAREPRRRCPRPPRGPRARSAGCRSRRRRTASPRGAPWSPAGRSRRWSSGRAPRPARARPGETPWAEKTTVSPSGTSSSSSTKTAPRDSRSATTCLLCTICLRT